MFDWIKKCRIGLSELESLKKEFSNKREQDKPEMNPRYSRDLYVKTKANIDEIFPEIIKIWPYTVFKSKPHDRVRIGTKTYVRDDYQERQDELVFVTEADVIDKAFDMNMMMNGTFSQNYINFKLHEAGLEYRTFWITDSTYREYNHVQPWLMVAGFKKNGWDNYKLVTPAASYVRLTFKSVYDVNKVIREMIVTPRKAAEIVHSAKDKHSGGIALEGGTLHIDPAMLIIEESDA